MTADLVANLVRAHLAASVLILAVLAARRPARRMVGPRVAYALWLLPVIGAAAVLLPPRIAHVAAPAASVAAPAALPMAALNQAAAAAAPLPAPSLDPWQILLWLWAAGAAGSLVVILVQHLRCLAFARAGAIGPAVVGFWRPRVVLPVDFEERYDERERALILEHEVTHIRRQDPRFMGAAMILRCLSWFNPLVYLAVAKLRIDQELACDETVVSRFPRARRAYAETLAKSQLAIRPLPLGCYWPTGTRHPLLERLAMLSTTRVGRRSRLAGSAALALLCGATGLAAWAASPPKVEYVTQPPIVVAAPAPARRTFDIAALERSSPILARATAEAAAPAEPAVAAPPIPNFATGMADMDTGAPVSISGTIVRMEWINPRTVIHVQDAVTGEVRRVMTETPNSLLRAGGNRQTVHAGMPISLQGYRAVSGDVVFASPVAMTSAGAPLFPKAAEIAAERQKLAEARKAACGLEPAPPANATPEEIEAWRKATFDCEPKARAYLAGQRSIDVIEQSTFTNAVIREGDRRASQPK